MKGEGIMASKYIRLTLDDRINIETGLDGGLSINRIAKAILRSPSTVAREIKANRIPLNDYVRRGKCAYTKECKETNVCGKSCSMPKGILCKTCHEVDCKQYCAHYANHMKCSILERSPYVCNHCRHRHYYCNRPNRYIYSAKDAQALSSNRKSSSRSGIDMDAEKADTALRIIKQGLKRGLSPYEISVLYEPEIGVHRSTIYRWIDRGYGGLSNIELERKVGFKPRTKHKRKATSHSPKRSYKAFLELSSDIRELTTEIDTVIGQKTDQKAVLTIYHRPSDLQLAIMLEEKTCSEVKSKLLMLKALAKEEIFEKLFQVCLTDNGGEFEDDEGLSNILGEDPTRNSEIHLYYCDIGQSQQKGSCEKNHSELRQILAKGLFSFDDLDSEDLRVLMSHANSNPRKCLMGRTPIEMFSAFFKKDGEDFLDTFGIRQIERDELCLTPDILNIERTKRGKEPLKRIQK